MILAYSGARGRDRTTDTAIFSRTFYALSHCFYWMCLTRDHQNGPRKINDLQAECQTIFFLSFKQCYFYSVGPYFANDSQQINLS